MGLVIVIILVMIVGYYVLLNWTKGYNLRQRQKWVEQTGGSIAEEKQKLDVYYKEFIKECINGENQLYITKKEIIDAVIENETIRRRLHIWDKKVKIVMAGDNDNRFQLLESWSDYVHTGASCVDRVKYGLDIESCIDGFVECKENFTALLETFGYNPDEDEEIISKEVSKDVKARFKNVSLPISNKVSKKRKK